MLAEVFVSALLPTNTMTLSESFDLQLPASSHKEEVPRGEEAEGCQSPQEKMYPLMLLGAGRRGWNSATPSGILPPEVSFPSHQCQSLRWPALIPLNPRPSTESAGTAIGGAPAGPPHLYAALETKPGCDFFLSWPRVGVQCSDRKRPQRKCSNLKGGPHSLLP